MPKVDVLRKDVESAQADLDTALAEGTDTIEARRKLKDVQVELSLVESKEAQKAGAERVKAKTARQNEAARMVGEAVGDLNANLQKLAHIEMPCARLPVHLGENILTAREQLNTDTEVKRVYRTRIGQLQEQQRVLEARRAKIVSRRAAGQGDDKEDGESLVLIQADKENLAQLIDREINSGDTQDTTRSELLFNEAQAVFESAFKAEQIRVLRELTGQLETLLVTAAQALASAPGVRAKDRYQPNPIIRKASQESLL